jgi:hypothetical protein
MTELLWKHLFDKRTENQQHTLNPMKTDAVCITYKTLISGLTEKTVRVHYKDRPVKLLRKTTIAYCDNHRKKRKQAYTVLAK